VSSPPKVRVMPTWYEKLGIPKSLIDEAGVHHVTDAEARGPRWRLKARPSKKLDMQLFPYPDPHQPDEPVVGCRGRLDNPSEGEGKYHGSSKSQHQRILYYPPNAAPRLKAKSTTLILVEAEKSVLALEAFARRTKRTELLPLGMGGCQGWRDSEYGVLPDLRVCDGRRVIVLLDANVETNPKVRVARDALIVELSSRRCEVLVANLLQLPDVNGPDDLLALPEGDKRMAEVLAQAEAAVVAPYSEHALAKRFASEQSDTLRYVPRLGWLRWNKQHWQYDEQKQMEMDVHNLCEIAAKECGSLAKAERIRSRKNIEAVVRLSQPYLSMSLDELDKDPMLLGTPNGVIDLRIGVLREARREDYITKLTTVAPDSKAKPKRWLRFMQEITLDEKELQDYLQVVAGYCLTGDISEHALFFLYGTGGNGKSVFVNILLGILGDYATVAAMDVFTATPYPQHSTSIARLRGARMVAATETEEGSRWAEAKLKAMTGGEPITARFMRENDFTFLPQFKPVISGNHKPTLRSADEAMRRSMHLVPFNLNLPKEKRDKQLAKKLQAERPAILHWAIAGCLRWQKEGLEKPEAVAEATEEYLAEQDVLGSWLETRTVKDPNGKEPPSSFYENYKAWAIAKGEHYILSQAQFSPRLAGRGFPTKKGHGGVRYVVGLRLRPCKAVPRD
jgi:P4 family phage/plasmid primase-like protien